MLLRFEGKLRNGVGERLKEKGKGSWVGALYPRGTSPEGEKDLQVPREIKIADRPCVLWVVGPEKQNKTI